MAELPGNVYGGSASPTDDSPIRMVEVRGDRRVAWSLDVTVTTGAAGVAVVVAVESGAGQTSIRKEYRLEAGRLVIPVTGDRVSVDARRVGAPAAPPRIVALLGEGSATVAPPATTTATAGTVVLGIGANVVPESSGVSRILRNDTAASVAVGFGGLTFWDVAPGGTLALDYGGPLDVVATAAGNLRVGTLHA